MLHCYLNKWSSSLLLIHKLNRPARCKSPPETNAAASWLQKLQPFSAGNRLFMASSCWLRIACTLSNDLEEEESEMQRETRRVKHRCWWNCLVKSREKMRIQIGRTVSSHRNLMQSLKEKIIWRVAMMYEQHSNVVSVINHCNQDLVLFLQLQTTHAVYCRLRHNKNREYCLRLQQTIKSQTEHTLSKNSTLVDFHEKKG